ncbi:MAG: hypothetical protein QXY61_03680 [Candidatus Anstonellales archaeon]
MKTKTIFGVLLVVGMLFSECTSQMTALGYGDLFSMGPFTGIYQYNIEDGYGKAAVFKLWQESEPGYVKAKLYMNTIPGNKVFFTTETADMLIIELNPLSSAKKKSFKITYCWNVTNMSTPIPVTMHKNDFLVTTEEDRGIGMVLDDFSEYFPDMVIVAFCDANLNCELNGGQPIKEQIMEGDTNKVSVPGFGYIYAHNYETNRDEGYAVLGIFPYDAFPPKLIKPVPEKTTVVKTSKGNVVFPIAISVKKN